MDEMDSQVDNFTFEAGNLCLNFANTAEWHASDQPTEYLNRYADLIAWALQAELLTAQEAEHLRHTARQRPDEAENVLDQAIELREAIYQIFSAVAADQLPETGDLARLNAALSEALVWLRITPQEDSFGWAWATGEDALEQMLWPVVRSAAELLTSDALDRVKECADDRGCGYLFMDMSRNRSRKWCDMGGCGNRAKVRRYRRKHSD